MVVIRKSFVAVAALVAGLMASDLSAVTTRRGNVYAEQPAIQQQDKDTNTKSKTLALIKAATHKIAHAAAPAVRKFRAYLIKKLANMARACGVQSKYNDAQSKFYLTDEEVAARLGFRQ